MFCGLNVKKIFAYIQHRKFGRKNLECQVFIFAQYKRTRFCEKVDNCIFKKYLCRHVSTVRIFKVCLYTIDIARQNEFYESISTDDTPGTVDH